MMDNVHAGAVNSVVPAHVILGRLRRRDHSECVVYRPSEVVPVEVVLARVAVLKKPRDHVVHRDNAAAADYRCLKLTETDNKRVPVQTGKAVGKEPSTHVSRRAARR